MRQVENLPLVGMDAKAFRQALKGSISPHNHCNQKRTKVNRDVRKFRHALFDPELSATETTAARTAPPDTFAVEALNGDTASTQATLDLPRCQ
jgi:hypothetical protein